MNLGPPKYCEHVNLEMTQSHQITRSPKCSHQGWQTTQVIPWGRSQWKGGKMYCRGLTHSHLSPPGPALLSPRLVPTDDGVDPGGDQYTLLGATQCLTLAMGRGSLSLFLLVAKSLNNLTWSLIYLSKGGDSRRFPRDSMKKIMRGHQWLSYWTFSPGTNNSPILGGSCSCIIKTLNQ